MSSALLLSCLGVKHDLPLLPHWLAHYRGLGVDPARTYLLLNAPDDDDPGLAQAEAISHAAGIQTRRWIAPYTSESMWQARRELQADVAGPEEWVMSADIDEHHDYPLPLAEMMDALDAIKATCLQGVFIDRLAPGGALAQVMPQPLLSEQFPLKAECTHSIGGQSQHHGRGGTVKIMLMRGDQRPSRGGHRAEPHPNLRYAYGRPLGDLPRIDDPAFRFSMPTQVHHYHWTGTLPERLAIRLATPGVSAAGAVYGRLQLDHFRRHGGLDLSVIPLSQGDTRTSWRMGVTRLRRMSRWRGIVILGQRILKRLARTIR